MITTTLVIVAAIGSGLVAGIFFAFSVFVMQSFANIPAGAAIRAMQEINRRIVRTLFIPLFFGTAIVCVMLLVTGVNRWSTPAGTLLVAASMAYLAGCILVTMLCNVPRNTRLGQLEPDSDDAARYWQDYLQSWTRWNHVRTVASLTAAVLYTISLLSQ